MNNRKCPDLEDLVLKCRLKDEDVQIGGMSSALIHVLPCAHHIYLSWAVMHCGNMLFSQSYLC